MKVENKRCCRHYREGLPYCAECAKDAAERNEALHAQIAELERELAEAQAEAEHWKGECSDLVRMAHEMRAEIDYFQTLIDLQHKRTVEANKLWQQAHNQPDVWPDLGKLVEWLLLRLKNQEAIIEANRATVKAKDAQIESMKCCQNCDNLGGRASRCGDCVRLIFVPDADSVDNWMPIKEEKKP